MNLKALDTDTAKLVLDSLADGVYVTDRDRKIIIWNAAAERMTGWPASEIIGSSCFDDILVHEDSDGHRLCGEDTCPLHRAIITEQPSTLSSMVFAQTKTGQRIPVEVSVAPVHDQNGNVVGGVESFRDLTPLLKDLEQARTIQNLAMHAEMPHDDRIELAAINTPAGHVTGDFFRSEMLGENSLVMMIADIMGHGIAAALHTMQLRSLWEEARQLLNQPALFMRHLNEQLYAVTREEDFFSTAFFGILDLTSLSLRYVIAGHPQPRIHHAGQTATPLHGHSPALGLLPDISFQEQQETLQPNDILLCFSDGALEIRGQDHTELGPERLCALFAECDGTHLNDRLRQLEARALAFAQGVRFVDDFTLMAVRLVSPEANPSQKVEQK
jgi:sigma-B regulation protein RsbU (phosphoserine phosphatase)